MLFDIGTSTWWPSLKSAGAKRRPISFSWSVCSAKRRFDPPSLPVDAAVFYFSHISQRKGRPILPVAWFDGVGREKPSLHAVETAESSQSDGFDPYIPYIPYNLNNSQVIGDIDERWRAGSFGQIDGQSAGKSTVTPGCSGKSTGKSTGNRRAIGGQIDRRTWSFGGSTQIGESLASYLIFSTIRVTYTNNKPF